MRDRRLRAGLLLLIALTGCANEESYPDRPITLICPWSVGGGTDRVSRQMALFLEHELGVPVNVINATGGRGVTGHSRGLRAAPDGYTLTMITVELNMLHWQDLTAISYKDAEPLMSINEDPAAVFVQSEAPWQSMNDLLAEVRSRPGEMRASGTASGGIWHLALAGWLQSQGLPPDAIKWIPMNGAAPSLQELASGGLDLVCCSLPEARTLLQSGRVKPLGVMSDQRVPGYEQVPTLIDQGMNWTMVGWRGLAVPEGTPQERVDVLVGAIRRIVTGETEVNGKTFPDVLAAEGFNNRWRPPDEFREFLAQSDEKFGKLLESEAFSRMSAGGIVGPRTFPYLLFALMGVLLVCLAAGRLVKATHRITEASRTSESSSDKGTGGEEPVPGIGDATTEEDFDFVGLINVGLTFAAVIAYILLVDRLGFVLTTGLLLVGLLWRFGTRLISAVGIAVLLVPAVYHLFAHLLRVPLPRGLLGW